MVWIMFRCISIVHENDLAQDITDKTDIPKNGMPKIQGKSLPLVIN